MNVPLRTLTPILVLTLCAACCLTGAQAAEEIVYEQNFEKATAGQSPKDLGMLEAGGEFKVTSRDGVQSLDLVPGALDGNFGVLFGPNQTDNVGASYKVLASAEKRRAPVFALGLSGVGGYLLRLNAAKKKPDLELIKGDQVKASAPFDWASGKWTYLAIRVVKAGAAWKIEGKAWTDGSPEPATWAVSFEDTEAPLKGQALIDAQPYTHQPLRFDDLKIWQIK